MKLITLASLLLLALNGCGGGGGTTAGPSAVSDKALASVAISDGNNQTGTVGTQLPAPLVALVLNQAGQPIAGQVVNFVVTEGGGSVFAAAVTSDTNGLAKDFWTLGTKAGAQKVEVRAIDTNGAPVVYAVFAATSITGPPQTVSTVTGDNQRAQQLQPLPLPAKVIVMDAAGNPVAGASVTFTASNGGSVQPGLATTDATGMASVTWTLGQALGAQTLSAAVAGAPSVSFSATATAAPVTAATTITKLSGDSQTVVQHLLLPLPLQVVVTDVLGNPVPNKQVTFSGNNTSVTVNTDSSGKASWGGSLNTAGQQTVDVSAAGLTTVTFNVNVTASNHTFDGMYLCTTQIDNTLAPYPGPNNIPRFTLQLINGLYISQTGSDGVRSLEAFGTLNEADGTVKFAVWPPSVYYSYDGVGQLVVDSAQKATGTGTYSRPNEYVGTWTCTRQ